MPEFLDRRSGRHSVREQRRVELEALLVETQKVSVGVITGFDANNDRADVQIMPMRKLEGDDVEVPMMLNVPVSIPFAGGLSLGFEPKDGDECIVLFADREIETAKQSSGTYELSNSRMNDWSDAICIPCRISGGGELVNLVQCFLELADIVRRMAAAANPPVPRELADVTRLISKLETAL